MPEKAGLPPVVQSNHSNQSVLIPMLPSARCPACLLARSRGHDKVSQELSGNKKSPLRFGEKLKVKNLFRQNMRKRKEKGMQCKECEIHDIPKELPDCPGCHGPLTKDTPQRPHNPLTHNSQPLATPTAANYTPSRAHKGDTPLNRAQRRKVPYALRKVVYSPRGGS